MDVDFDEQVGVPLRRDDSQLEARVDRALTVFVPDAWLESRYDTKKECETHGIKKFRYDPDMSLQAFENSVRKTWGLPGYLKISMFLPAGACFTCCTFTDNMYLTGDGGDWARITREHDLKTAADLPRDPGDPRRNAIQLTWRNKGRLKM